MFEAVWVSLRKLEELCGSVEHEGLEATEPATHQRILSELAVANAYYRQLVRAQAEARNGPLCLIISRQSVNDVERALIRLRDRAQVIGICSSPPMGSTKPSRAS